MCLAAFSFLKKKEIFKATNLPLCNVDGVALTHRRIDLAKLAIFDKLLVQNLDIKILEENIFSKKKFRNLFVYNFQRNFYS